MRRSYSENDVHPVQAQHKSTFSSSSQFCDRFKTDKTRLFGGESFAIIKDSANARKCMHVIMQARNGLLRFNIVQQQGNVQETFTLATVVINELLICWNWHDVQLFIVCVLEGQRIQGDIWCYTSTALRSKWLSLLHRDGARTAHLRNLRHSVLGWRGVLQIDNLLLHIRSGGEADFGGSSRSARNSHSPEKLCNKMQQKQQLRLYAFLICCACIVPLAATIYMLQQKNI